MTTRDAILYCIDKGLCDFRYPGPDAVVVVLLAESHSGLDVLFEVRSDLLDRQPGETCLPGGIVEKGESAYAAAVRETCEELSLEADQFEMLGELGQINGPNGMNLTVYAALAHDYEGTFNEQEVKQVFRKPLEWFMENDPVYYALKPHADETDEFPWHLVPNGRSYPFGRKEQDVPFYLDTNPVIWGFTARVMHGLSRSLRVAAEIEKLARCESERFSAHDYRGNPSAPEFEFSNGSLPILLSAPHAVTHIRDGKVKPSEDYTGAIALACAERLNCHAVVATRSGSGDPNWDSFESSSYKQAVCNYVREHNIAFVLDIHGMVAASHALVALGSADGKTVRAAPGLDEEAADLLRTRLSTWSANFGKPIVLNGLYGARSKNTVAQTVANECGIPTLQIEIATQLRVPIERASRIPKGEPIPFSNEQLPIELTARRHAEPLAVSALIDALCEVALLGANDNPAVSINQPGGNRFPPA